MFEKPRGGGKHFGQGLRTGPGIAATELQVDPPVDTAPDRDLRPHQPQRTWSQLAPGQLGRIKREMGFGQGQERPAPGRDQAQILQPQGGDVILSHAQFDAADRDRRPAGQLPFG